MANPGVQPLIEAVFAQLDAVWPKKGIETVSTLRKELERNLRAAFESRLATLDLVSRSEFEVQQAVLARARQQLADMAAQLAELEQKLNKTASKE